MNEELVVNVGMSLVCVIIHNGLLEHDLYVVRT